MKRCLSLWPLALVLWTSSGWALDLKFPADQFGQANLAFPQSLLHLESMYRGDDFERLLKFRPQSILRRTSDPVGRLDVLLEDDDGNTALSTCTATVISEQHILTNHHCIPGIEPQWKVQKALLRMGFLSEESYPGENYPVELPALESSAALDYSILKVLKNPAKTYGTLPLKIRTPLPQEDLIIFQHPAGKPKRLVRKDCRMASRLTPSDLRHTCDTMGGSSGSPILSQEDYSWVGLHYLGGATESEESYNSAKRMQAILNQSEILKRLVSSTQMPAKIPPVSKTLPVVPKIKAPTLPVLAQKPLAPTKPIPDQTRLSAFWSGTSFFGVGQSIPFHWKVEGAQSLKLYLQQGHRGPWRLLKQLKDLQSFNWVPKTAGQMTLKLESKGKQNQQSRTLKILVMAHIPGGRFIMGNAKGRKNEKPEHPVDMPSFYIDPYEVTQAEYQKCMNRGPCQQPNFSEKGQNHPVVGVSWTMAKAYCAWHRKRLPTEAEWEKAARGGQEEIPDNEDSLQAYAWYGQNSGLQSHPVASKAPNAFGIFDMSGNVWEWVSDWYAPYASERSSNPQGPENGRDRLIRGGSWKDLASQSSPTRRYYNRASYTSNHLGFRCATNAP